MDDFPQDELDFIDDGPSTSSSVVAIDVLGPPSPILTPSQLAFTWSSDEIPFMLFDDAYVLDARGSKIMDPRRTSLASVAASHESSHRLSCASRRISTLTSNDGGDDDNDGDAQLSPISSSNSCNTLSSVGTFGPKRKALKVHDTNWPEVPPLEVSSPTDRYMSRQNTITHRDYGYKSPSTPRSYSRARASQVPTNGPPTTPTSSNRQCHTADVVPRGEENISAQQSIPCVTDGGQNSRESADDTTETMIHGLSHIEDVLSADSSPWQRPGRVHRRALQMVDTNAGLPPNRSRTISVLEGATKEEHPIPLSKNLFQEGAYWLKDLIVEFLVDQEGFRAARPTFKFTGITYLRSDKDNPASPRVSIAQFRPVTRQIFHFHYEPFESPPILRRVTVNDDDTHDYVSRQAYLTLKSNGVYVVHGHEVSSIDHDGDHVKLQWQFEYLVDDRRIETFRKITEGEKVLTPLTFSCSPNLLLPGQAKRLSVIHVFKKGVAPKLVAEKLQPPSVHRPSNDAPPLKMAAPKADSPLKPHGWNLHRRVQSHVHQKDVDPESSNPLEYQAGTPPHSDKRPLLYRSDSKHGHHRATSAGENYISPSKHLTMSPSHILPPAQLDELMDAQVSTPTTPVGAQPAPDPTGFTPLAPRPRRGKDRDSPRTLQNYI